MKKHSLLACLACIFLSLAVYAWSSEVLTFTKSPSDVDVAQLVDELESSTGLIFAAKCSTCVVNGSITHVGNQLQVLVYTELIPQPEDMPVISSTTWSQDLSDSITSVVGSHVP